MRPCLSGRGDLPCASLPGSLARDSSRRRWEPMNAGDDGGLNHDGGVPGVLVGPAVDPRGGRAIWRRRRGSSAPPSAAQRDRAGPRPHAHANPRTASRPHAPLTRTPQPRRGRFARMCSGWSRISATSDSWPTVQDGAARRRLSFKRRTRVLPRVRRCPRTFPSCSGTAGSQKPPGMKSVAIQIAPSSPATAAAE